VSGIYDPDVGEQARMDVDKIRRNTIRTNTDFDMVWKRAYADAPYPQHHARIIYANAFVRVWMQRWLEDDEHTSMPYLATTPVVPSEGKTFKRLTT